MSRLLCWLGFHAVAEWWNGKVDRRGRPEVLRYCERAGCTWERWR